MIFMGLKNKLKDMTHEYLKDPQTQYFKYLDKILALSQKNHIPKRKVLEHVQSWAEK